MVISESVSKAVRISEISFCFKLGGVDEEVGYA